MATLLLLRHGQIDANRKGLWHGSTDSSLTWRGRRQARKTARHLAHNQRPIDAIYTSPLERCVHTAEQIANNMAVKPVVVEALREYGIGDWEGLAFQHLTQTHDFISRATRDLNFAPPGGESLSAVAERIVPALKEIHEAHPEDAQILVVSHGAALAVALSTLIDRTPTRWVDYQFSNCSLTELVLSPAPYVNFFNSTQHL